MRQITISLSKRSIAKTVGFCVLGFMLVFAGMVAGTSLMYNDVKKEGYNAALSDVSDLLKQQNVSLTWTETESGVYSIQIMFLSASGKPLTVHLTYEYHLTANQFRPYANLDGYWKVKADTVPLGEGSWMYWYDINGNGKQDFPGEYKFLISSSSHPMTLTNHGRDWITEKIFHSGGTNGTKFATYISNSNSTSAFDAAWVVIPSEIVDSGLTRANGSYVDIAGTGNCNVTYTFSCNQASGTNLYGLNYDSTTGTLVAAEQQDVGARKNMLNGDSLQVTIQETTS